MSERISTQPNVLGEPLESCSLDPVTGWYRNGCCETGGDDTGVHTVCAIMTDDFLEFSKAAGNDLSTPMPQYGFAGLKAGDRILPDASGTVREGARVTLGAATAASAPAASAASR